MTDALIAACSAVLTGLLSLLGVYIANRKSAALIEYQVKEVKEQVRELKDQVAKHNSFGDRITTIETEIKGLTKDMDDLKRKVSA